MISQRNDPNGKTDRQKEKESIPRAWVSLEGRWERKKFFASLFCRVGAFANPPSYFSLVVVMCKNSEVDAPFLTQLSSVSTDKAAEASELWAWKERKIDRLSFSTFLACSCRSLYIPYTFSYCFVWIHLGRITLLKNLAYFTWNGL